MSLAGDFATGSADGFIVKGPTNQASCCAACVAHAHPKPCRAAVWVPARHECVLKLNISQPKKAVGTVACVPPSSPLPPPPPPPPPGPIPEETYLTLDRRNIVRKDEAVRMVLAPVVKEPRNPLLTEQKKWEMRFDNMGAPPPACPSDEMRLMMCVGPQTGPNVWHDPAAGRWKAWYSSFTSCAHPGM